MELTDTLAQALIENAGHSIYYTDRDGTIQDVNPSFEKMTGYSREEIIGEDPSILQSGKHSDSFYEELWSTILSGEIWHSEIINRRKNGELYYVDQTISPVTNDTGDIVGFVAINVDITERKEKRNFIEQLYSRLDEQKSQLSRELHDQLGHDLLYVLMQIRRHGMDDNSPNGSNEEQVIESLEKSINRIRDMSSLLRPPSLEQGNLVDAIKSQVEKTSAQHEVNVDVEAIGKEHDQTPDTEVLQGLYRIAQEAIMNAVNHGKADQISIIVSRKPEKLSLMVEDDGVGFRPDELKNRPLEGRVGITGMRERARLMNGNFTLESNPGEGTRVKVRVPV